MASEPTFEMVKAAADQIRDYLPKHISWEVICNAASAALTAALAVQSPSEHPDSVKLREAVEHIQRLIKVYSEPDQRLCCTGQACGCMGATVQQEAEHYTNVFLSKLGGTNGQ